MKGFFQITGWDELAYSESDDGSKKSHAKISQTYSGAINGSSELQYLMSYQSKALAVFVGFEVITGEINGKSGSFTIQHNGKFENGIAKSNFIVVPNSGTEELKNIHGHGAFTSAEAGKADYEIEFSL
jgi:hypothetical protein